MIGKTIGNLKIVSELGKGGMGVVYLAEHMRLDKKFAVKSLSPELTQEPLFRERFYHEAKNQGQLDHLNIVQVTDFFEEYEQFFLVMEFVDGVTLGDLIEKKGPLSEEEAFPILKDILAGLGFAHSKGIIHRDIKPANVMVNRDGRGRIMDFGIAILADEKRLTGTGRNIGSPWYMSPEQISKPKEIDQRSDIYSLGVLMFELFTGRVPFEGETEFTVQNQHINSPPLDPLTLNPAIGEECSRIILRAMEKSPDKRFQSCAEFLQAIKACESTPSEKTTKVWAAETKTQPETVAHKSPPPENRTKSRSKKTFIIAAIAASLLAVTGIALFTWYLEQRTTATAPTSLVAQKDSKPAVKPSAGHPENLVDNTSVPTAKESAKKTEESLPTPTAQKKQEPPRTNPTKVFHSPRQEASTDSKTISHTIKLDKEEAEKPAEKSSSVSKVPRKREVFGMISVKVFHDIFENGTDGPEMVVIPAGTFMMGPFWEDGKGDNKPAHKVSIEHPFALGKDEVTFVEYDAFAKATGKELPNDEGWGRGERPVINVSWHDALAYAEWLSQQTGKRYRLPSEAEWEYAARSKGKDEKWAGTSIPEELGNYAWNIVNSDHESQPVGMKKSNRISLYDMSGNVAEWVEDCWNRGYFNAPNDGTPWETGDCGQRVIRGGSFSDKAQDLPLVLRRALAAESRTNHIGFRLAREM